MKKIIAGNWKMNGDPSAMENMLDVLKSVDTENQVIICPPFTLLGHASGAGRIDFGAQDCSAYENGARTGEISAAMIAATEAKYVIVGHSERRQYHNETNEIVAAKAAKAITHGLTPIICVGESLSDKQAGKTLQVIEEQVKNSTIGLQPSSFIIAYEPVWAIGTGLVPTNEDIAIVHARIAALTPAPILYGGSVNKGNAAQIMSIENVAGVLVGGASLKPDEFVPIIMS